VVCTTPLQIRFGFTASQTRTGISKRGPKKETARDNGTQHEAVERRGERDLTAVYLLQAEFRQAKHTIILVQYTRDPNSRTYLDFESVNGGMDGVVKMYEAKLKQLNPNLKNITYDIQDLYTYIDSLTDLSALVLDLETKTYLPCGKEWIKKKVFQVLKNQAG
jgi:hypothetical protein